MAMEESAKLLEMFNDFTQQVQDRKSLKVVPFVTTIINALEDLNPKTEPAKTHTYLDPRFKKDCFYNPGNASRANIGCSYTATK